MNLKLTDEQIVSTIEVLRQAGESVSGRALRAALRRRFGASGKTARIYAACSVLRHAGSDASGELAELRHRVHEAEQGREEAQLERERAIGRAQRSEAREIAHQDLWANEIHALRQSVQQLKGEGDRRRALEKRVIELHRELQGLRHRLAHNEELASK